MQEDRRRIQTAVLGSAESDEPLMLPLEAIELDAFRRRHEHDSFWCGLLLGGCGGQLTTKLYTDRVCHFAHFPDPDGLPHECGRRARGVASADHLYVKSAATTWFRERGTQPRFDFARPDGVPFGSVVDIEWPGGGLRVHLDQAVEPAWEEGREPVLSVSVPVDRETLVYRWYVHRIRLESEGTARRVRIGTEAFARPTEWFALEECGLSERGLTTPAVERIVRARRTPPPFTRSAATEKPPPAQAHAQTLLWRLAGAQQREAVHQVERVCREIDAVKYVDEETTARLTAAAKDAHRWLKDQAQARQALFARLDEAVRAQDTPAVRKLLQQARTVSADDRTESEAAVIEAARNHCTAIAQAAPRWAAAARARKSLKVLARQGRDQATSQLRPRVEKLTWNVAAAGDLLTEEEAAQAAEWKALLTALEERDAIVARPAPPRRNRRGPQLSGSRTPKETAAAPRRTSSDAIQELLDELEKKRDTVSDKKLRRMVAHLVKCAAPAMPDLTWQQQSDIARWKRRIAPPDPVVCTDTDPAQEAAPASVPRRPRATEQAVGPPAATVSEMAAAARDVLEHAARLGKTVPWARLCADVRGLAALPEDGQRDALRQAGTVPGTHGLRLSALVTTETGEPHHLHCQESPEVREQTGWHTTIQRIHHHYRRR